MDERAEIGGRTYADSEVFPSQSLYVTFSQKTHITAHKHVRVLRQRMEHVSPLFSCTEGYIRVQLRGLTWSVCVKNTESVSIY